MLLILIIGFTTSISAQETIKVGVIYPMTGPLADVARQIVDGITLAIDIVNGEFPNLVFDLASTAGLPNLNGAKIQAVVGNTQGQPEFGRAEAERLITLENVVTLQGCYQSGVTKTASQVAEMYQTPFINALSSATDLTERGFKYFFRVWLTDAIYIENYMQFFEYLNKEKNANIKKIACLAENNDFGVGVAKDGKAFAEEYGFEFGPDIRFDVGTIELDSEILLLKMKQPDFVMCPFTLSGGILYIEAAKKLEYNAPGLAGCSSGFSDPAAVRVLGKDLDYTLSRGAFPADLKDEFPLFKKVNEMYKDRHGLDMNLEANSAFTAMMITCEAINRAGSTDKEAIRKALTETDIPADKLINYSPRGFQFDEKGQNKYSQGLIFQMRDGVLRTVWPLETAKIEVVHPIPKWSER
jgi:branched-chain amino acid transport system substrate-binding protein